MIPMGAAITVMSVTSTEHVKRTREPSPQNAQTTEAALVGKPVRKQAIMTWLSEFDAHLEIGL